MALPFALACGALVVGLRESRASLGIARDLKRQAHRYSGVSPEDYKTFAKELRRCELIAPDHPRDAARHLWYALDALQNLALFNHYDISSEIDVLCQKIGLEYETMLFEHFARKRMAFQGRYLNERLHV